MVGNILPTPIRLSDTLYRLIIATMIEAQEVDPTGIVCRIRIISHRLNPLEEAASDMGYVTFPVLKGFSF